jgi:arsenate reductase
MIALHGIPNCDTVKKARAWLDAQGVDYRFRDFKKEPPSAAELSRWADRAGWDMLLNRRGTTFRALPETDKADIDHPKALALMEAHPSLIKRPVVEEGTNVTVGFVPAMFAEVWSK